MKCTRCNRKLVNFETCIPCNTQFHPKCLQVHNAEIHSQVSNPATSDTMSNQASPQIPNTAPKNFDHIPIRDFAPPPALPESFTSLTPDMKSDAIMQVLMEVRSQNIQLKEDITATTAKTNYHSSVLAAHDADLHRLSAEQSDLHHAFADRHPTSEIIVSAIPKTLALSRDQICAKIFQFLELHENFSTTYILGTRFVNHKTVQATNSIVIEMVGEKVCDKVIIAGSKKRKIVPLSLRNIFGIDDDSLIFISKMLPPYYQNLSYQARQAKKKHGWSRVSVYNGNIIVKTTDQAPPITISTLAQLESISQ